MNGWGDTQTEHSTHHTVGKSNECRSLRYLNRRFHFRSGLVVCDLPCSGTGSGSVRLVLKPRVVLLPLLPRQKDGDSDSDSDSEARAAVNDRQKDKGEGDS